MNFIASTPGLPEHALKGGMQTGAFAAQREWVRCDGFVTVQTNQIGGRAR